MFLHCQLQPSGCQWQRKNLQIGRASYKDIFGSINSFSTKNGDMMFLRSTNDVSKHISPWAKSEKRLSLGVRCTPRDNILFLVSIERRLSEL